MTDYQEYINALRKCAKEHENDTTYTGHIIVSDLCRDTANLLEALEQSPCCNCILFKRYAKQMGFSIEPQSIPYLMHTEMDIPISECQKAYDIAIDYLRSQGKLKG